MLDVDGLADYTGGRLDPDDDETAALLARSLAAVRRWCGWHVCPVLADQVLGLDGPGGRLLRLPTLRLIEVSAAAEDGLVLDPAGLEWSRIGLVRKRSGAFWTCRFGGITVSVTHGFVEAADFESVVFSIADRMAQIAGGGAPSVVGPFRWAAGDMAAGSAFPGTPFTSTELSILEQYRLERPA